MARRNPEVWFWPMGGDIQRLVGETTPGRRLSSRSFWEPKVDLFEDDGHFHLRFELAGVCGEDVQLLYLPDSHSVLLRGVRKEDDSGPAMRTGCHQLEIYYGEFEREIELPPTPIEAQEVRAQFRNGFLDVVVPKAKAVFRHTKISIRKV